VSTLVLLLLMAAAVALQLFLDARNVGVVARQNGWSEWKLRWVPSLRRWLTGSRWTRSYWLHYRDEHGRGERRLCHVTTNWSDGPAGVVLEPTVGAGVSRSRARRGSLFTITATAALGASVGLALGIVGAFLLYPGSNIAPAYGVILAGPVGMVAGLLVGILRARPLR